MNEKIKNILCLTILIVVPIVLLILCATGYSFKKTRLEKEHFLSTITNYFGTKQDLPENKDVTPNLDEKNNVVSKSAPFPPDKLEFDDNDNDNITNNINNVNYNYKELSDKDLEQKFKPKSTFLDDISNPKTIENPSNKYKNLNENNNLMNNISKTPNKIKDLPILNIKPQSGGPNNLINPGSFMFFDESEKPSNDYVYTGAELGIDGDVPINFSCGKNMNSVKAEGVARITENGEIDDIIMIKNGKGYNKADIELKGGSGHGFKGRAIVNDNTEISHVEIIDKGTGYISTPNVIFSNPNKNKKCKLYFKKNK